MHSEPVEHTHWVVEKYSVEGSASWPLTVSDGRGVSKSRFRDRPAAVFLLACCSTEVSNNNPHWQ